jgi:anti-sigma factor RsiW
MSRPDEMTHPEEGTLLALLDGELPERERAELALHLERCPPCAAALREMEGLRGLFAGAVAATDVPAPADWALHSVRRRARAGHGVQIRRALLRAALLVLGFAGIAYAAVPGSPVRHWISRLVAPPATPAREPELHPAPAPVAAAARERAPAGVSIEPQDGGVRVVLSASGPDLRVRARVSDGERAEVFATGEAAGARFRTGPGRVEVVGARGGEVNVALPRSARTAVIEADGRILLSREGGRVRVLAPVMEGAGQEMVFRVGP